MTPREFKLRGNAELFPQKGGWFYVRVPARITNATKHLADRGLVAVSATVGDSSWNTSLLPMGDGSQFVALPAKVRKKERIAVGGRVTLTLRLRDR